MNRLSAIPLLRSSRLFTIAPLMRTAGIAVLFFIFVLCGTMGAAAAGDSGNQMAAGSADTAAVSGAMAQAEFPTELSLDQLMQRDDGPFVVKLAREPGKREIRFAHLFGGEPEMPGAAAPARAVTAAPGADAERIEQLEQVVSQLRDEVAALKARLDRLSPQQEPGS